MQHNAEHTLRASREAHAESSNTLDVSDQVRDVFLMMFQYSPTNGITVLDCRKGNAWKLSPQSND
jgi:hypothetical protein